MSRGDPAPFGDPVLDGMLRGGVPRNRSVLVTGGPGTGKSTLGMQFLQSGLEDGESGLFISTEQSFEELHDSFAGYDYDLDHPEIAFATVHATTGETLEGGDELVLRHLGETDPDGGGEVLGDAFNAPFTARYIQRYLDFFTPVDRVVFDSVSGLSVMSDDDGEFRRTVLELVQFFTEEFGATTLLTAEAEDPDARVVTPLQYSTHGVIELSRERVNDDPHRFLTVTKMRGVDHDTRRVELEFVPGGVRVGPSRRSQPPELKTHHHTPIGVSGLDALCGGGLATGTGVLLEHDGYANLRALFGAIVHAALDREMALFLVPTIRMRPGGFDAFLADREERTAELLESDRLFVLDQIGAWDETDRNVFAARESATGVQSVLEVVAGRSADRSRLALVNADAMVDSLGPDDARTVRHWQESRMLREEDLTIHVHNPRETSDEVSGFYTTAAEQVIRTWLSDDGLQYVTLEKSPCGFVGTTSLVEYTKEPPYLRVQDPPQERENPYATDP
ncbi:RAD55 family ATPase [Salinirubellus sp. GCM10025818]|uniref:RAD55 family ATPase n=1 Tax=Salinirubellus TaxID=2162630 RepID=UPI0030CD3CA1